MMDGWLGRVALVLITGVTVTILTRLYIDYTRRRKPRYDREHGQPSKWIPHLRRDVMFWTVEKTTQYDLTWLHRGWKFEYTRTRKDA